MTVNSVKLLETLDIIKKNIAFWSQGTYVWVADPAAKDEFWKRPEPEAYPSENYYAWSSQVVPDNYVDPIVGGNECKTAYCFAGFAGLANGFPKPTIGMVLAGNWYNRETGQDVAQFARQTLGLSNYQADELFDGDNELVHLEFIVNYLAENPDATDDDFDTALEQFLSENPRRVPDEDEWYDDEEYDED